MAPLARRRKKRKPWNGAPGKCGPRGGDADTPRQHLRRALCVARTYAQSWAPGPAAAKGTARGRKKGPQRARSPKYGPPPDQETLRAAVAQQM
ncbi:hypothetical protein NDU88_011489 [Pleurodeles waltl]|uniref:Uncharacterized protein n=1 Tax=Pleurodeles waltl TaxID=8319 RepID=A0AAV7Q0T1_PLEWA|nr:hypothetical protein NDU88_011489 [Pleurodeles waltl]